MAQHDYSIQEWIFNTILDDVVDLLVSDYIAARALWVDVKNLFVDNQQARILQLENKIRTTWKGSLTISQYCQVIKNLAYQLGHVNALISKSALILQILRGLPSVYESLLSFIPLQRPFPTFLKVQNFLKLLKDCKLDEEAKA